MIGRQRPRPCVAHPKQPAHTPYLAHASHAQPQAGHRRGMTLIEVMMAITILVGAMLSIAMYMAKFAKAISSTDVKATANEIAADQIENAKGAPRYQAIDSLYGGTVAMAGTYTGYTRKTLVTRTGGGAADFYDYKTITVVVTNPRLSSPVKKTDIIAAF